MNNNEPSDGLVRKWIEDWAGGQMKGPITELQRVVAAQAAQWGWEQRGAANEAELQRARDEELEAMLAEPEPEGLTDDELLELMPEGFRGDLILVTRMAAHGAGPDVGPGLFRVSLNAGALDYARAVEAAVLARYSHPTPQPPADGEVAELVAWLRKTGKLLHPDYSSSQVPYMRCAELLQHQHPRPAPVSKRLPGAKDCDNRGRCWTTDHDPSLVYSPVWKMTGLPRQDLGHDFSNAYFWRNVRFWLPAHALPVPTEQDEAQ